MAKAGLVVHWHIDVGVELSRLIFFFQILIRKITKLSFHSMILWRASEAGSPTNRLGSGQRRDTDQGPFSL